MVARQLHISLNARKYRPLLDAIKAKTALDSLTDSTLVGLWLFATYHLLYCKNRKGLTPQDFLMQEWHDTPDPYVIIAEFARKYERFLKDGTLPDQSGIVTRGHDAAPR